MTKRLTATLTPRRTVDMRPQWSSAGMLSGITFGTPRLGATFETIDVELPFAEDGGTISRAYFEARRADLSGRVVRSAADAHVVRIAAGADTTAYGDQSAIYFPLAGWLEDDTAYEVRAHVQDDTGVWARVYLGTVTTREDAIPAADTLTPTRWVATGGSDAAAGTTVGAPWESVQRAITNTPSGGVCLIGPGYYTRPTTARTAAVTLLAEYPAVDDGGKNGTEINVGQQSVIEGPYVTAPTGTAAWSSAVSQGPYHVAPWTAVQVEGTGQTRTGGTVADPGEVEWFGTDDPSGNGDPNGTLWMWTPPDTPIQLNASANAVVGYGATRADAPRQIGWVRRDTSVCAEVGGFAEILFTNREYRYALGAGACYQDADGIIYLALPNNARTAAGTLSRNPNDLWLKFGDNEPGIEINADDVRISGFAFHSIGWGVEPLNAKNCALIDHNLIANAVIGVRVGQQSVASAGGQDPDRYANDTTIERNIFRNRNTWSDDHANDRPIPWHVIKDPILLENGENYEAAGGYTGAYTRWISTSETTAIHGRGGGVRTVTRDNLIDGYFNGIVPMGITPGETRYAGYGCATYRNRWQRISDDVFEYDLRVINVVGWDNDIEDVVVYMSVSPTDCGPILHFRDRIYRMGRRGVGKVDEVDPGLSSVLIKHSGGSDTRAIVHLYHLTLWAEDDGSGFVIGGPSRVSAPFNNQEESIRLRNSILRVTGDPIDHYPEQTVDVDYCLLVTTAPATYGLRWRTATTDVRHRTTAGWRTASGQGEHVNVVDGATVEPTDYAILDALLTDPTTGDLTLTVAGQAQLVGEVIPGISDALGRTPRLGYQP